MMKQSFLLFSLILILGAATFLPASAQSYSVLHSFQDGSVPNDGSFPRSTLVIGGDGNFYGTTQSGGSTINSDPNHAGFGTAFKMTPTGVVTILHSFGDGTVANDGQSPAAVIRGSDGNVYGITYGGGSLGYGTVFKMTLSGTVTLVHNFLDGSVSNDGTYPAGLAQGNDGNLYGMTYSGGTTVSSDPLHSGYGTVFKLTPTGTETILHNFHDESVTNDGANPDAALILGSDGNFYGTTEYGGTANAGTVFKMTPAGTVTLLHTFDDGTVVNDGADPQAPLVRGSDGNFYGTTYQGGSTGYGVVFRMTSTGTVTILHDFDDGTVGNDDSNPEAALIQGSDGNFYGTAYFGGYSSGGYAYGGTVFKITPAGTRTVLHKFVGNDDGSLPDAALVQGSDGAFYGMTQTGGTAHFGTIYRLDPTGVPAVWSARDVAAVSDGTSRLLWTRSDGAAGIWVMSRSDTQTTIGATYGPYTGWTAKDIAAAGDGTARLLWTRSDGAAGVWALNTAGTETTIGTTYGPYTGWTAKDIATASNGTSRLLWTNANGAASVWTLNVSGTETGEGPTYGPYAGWTAKAVGASGDGTARILWTRSDGAAGLWVLNASDGETTEGATYGPYSDSHGTWSAGDMATNTDGTSDVLWKRSDGAMGVWSFGASGTETIIGSVYGPYPGFTAAALDAAGDQPRVLWVRADRAAGLWTFGANDTESVIGSVYGPY